MRPIWSGTISFALVSVLVRMLSATESKDVRLHFVHRLRESVKQSKKRSTRTRARKAS